MGVAQKYAPTLSVLMAEAASRSLPAFLDADSPFFVHRHILLEHEVGQWREQIIFFAGTADISAIQALTKGGFVFCYYLYYSLDFVLLKEFVDWQGNLARAIYRQG